MKKQFLVYLVSLTAAAVLAGCSGGGSGGGSLPGVPGSGGGHGSTGQPTVQLNSLRTQGTDGSQSSNQYHKINVSGSFYVSWSTNIFDAPPQYPERMEIYLSKTPGDTRNDGVNSKQIAGLNCNLGAFGATECPTQNVNMMECQFDPANKSFKCPAKGSQPPVQIANTGWTTPGDYYLTIQACVIHDASLDDDCQTRSVGIHLAGGGTDGAGSTDSGGGSSDNPPADGSGDEGSTGGNDTPPADGSGDSGDSGSTGSGSDQTPPPGPPDDGSGNDGSTANGFKYAIDMSVLTVTSSDPSISAKNINAPNGNTGVNARMMSAYGDFWGDLPDSTGDTPGQSQGNGDADQNLANFTVHWETTTYSAPGYENPVALPSWPDESAIPEQITMYLSKNSIDFYTTQGVLDTSPDVVKVFSTQCNDGNAFCAKTDASEVCQFNYATVSVGCPGLSDAPVSMSQLIADKGGSWKDLYLAVEACVDDGRTQPNGQPEQNCVTTSYFISGNLVADGS